MTRIIIVALILGSLVACGSPPASPTSAYPAPPAGQSSAYPAPVQSEEQPGVTAPAGEEEASPYPAGTSP
ncbi:MAG: hypothetical protein M3380_07355 [Chloroflexota bacterium]|nr:hypothetical protein [Chloroflexota bacterium]